MDIKPIKEKISGITKELFADALNEKNNIKRSFPDFFNELAVRSKNIIKPENRKGLLVDFLSVVVIGLVVALLCSVKDGGMDLYLSIMLPFVAICFCQFAFVTVYDSSILYATLTVILVFLGSSLQIMLMLPAENTSGAYKLAFFAAVGTVLGLIAIPVVNYMFNAMNKRLAALIILCFIALIYLVLLVFAPNISGTRAWLVIGSVSIQLTEVTKVLTVMAFACVYTDEKSSPNQRLIYALAILAVNAGGLVLVNELGTLIVISIIFIVLGTTFLPSAKGLLAVVLVGIVCVAGLVGFSYKCYKVWYAEPEVSASEPVAEEADGNEFATVSEEQPQKTHGALYNKVVGKAANVFYKIQTRFMLVLNPDSLDEYGEGYQAKMARKAMLVTGWLGTAEEYEQNVPVIESDYIFLYVLMKIGIVGAFIVLAMLMAMMIETVIKVANCGRMTESAAAIGFICCIVVQSIITAASSAGLIPTVGLTFAFLSDGGSATVMNYFMTYFVLFAMRKPIFIKNERAIQQTETESVKSPVSSRGAICRTE